MLTDTRTLGRFAAIGKACPGRQVLLVRNIFHQWASYSEQWAGGNDYFFAMQRKTIDASRRDPFVALIAEWFDEQDKSPRNAATFQLFLLFHLYLYVHAFNSADLVVDANRITADPNHRAFVEARLTEYVRFPIDLSDARSPFGLSLFSTPSKAAFLDGIDQFAKQMIDGSVSAEAAAFAMRVKDDALEEWERCAFYGGAQRRWSTQRVQRVEAASRDSEAALALERKDGALLRSRIERLKRAIAKRSKAAVPAPAGRRRSRADCRGYSPRKDAGVEDGQASRTALGAAGHRAAHQALEGGIPLQGPAGGPDPRRRCRRGACGCEGGARAPGFAALHRDAQPFRRGLRPPRDRRPRRAANPRSAPASTLSPIVWGWPRGCARSNSTIRRPSATSGAGWLTPGSPNPRI